MAFLTTAQQNKLKALYPEITNWDFERYTYGVSEGDVGLNTYKKISTRGRKLLNPSQRLQLKKGRKQSRVNLTSDVKNKIANFKSAPGLSFNLEQDRRGDADRTPRIRVRIGKPKPGYTGGKSFTFDASPEGYEQAVKKHNELKKFVGKVLTPGEIAAVSNKVKTDYNNLKKTYADDLVKWVDANATNEKYQLKGGVDKLFKDAFKEFNQGKYKKIPETSSARGSDAWLKKNLFVKDGKFQFTKNYELLEGFSTGGGGYTGHTNIFKQFLAYKLLDKNPNFTTTMQDLTDFYTGQKKKTDFTQKELSRLQKFASDNNIGGASTLGKLLAQKGFDFNNKIFEFTKFKTVYESLQEELKQPGLPEYRQNQIRTAMSRITRNSDTVLKQLKAEYPNLFKSQSMVLEHANPQAFTKTESFFPKNFRLKAQYAPSAFNQLKNINFDQEFVRLSSRYNNETNPIFKKEIKDKIEKLVKDFNNKTKVKGVGYLDDLDIQFGKDKIRVTDKAKLISDITDQDTILQVLKNTAHSNKYLENFPDVKVKLNVTTKGSYPVKDLQLEVPTAREVSQNPNLTKFFSDIRKDAAANGPICKVVGKFNKGGSAISCVDAVEDAIQNEPEKLAQGASRIGKFKTAALGFLKSGGFKTFGVAGLAGGAAAALVKEFRNDDPTTYLSNEDQQKNMLVDMVTQPISTDMTRPDILDYQLPAVGASLAASTALGAPSTIKASRSRGLGVEQKGLIRTGGRVLGRGLGIAASPGVLAPLAALDITRQVSEGDSLADIATDPLNYTYPIFAEQTPRFTRGLPSTFRKFASLGLSKPALKLLSRAGIAGLGASLAIQGLGLLDD
jgi:hypothetical protein